MKLTFYGGATSVSGANYLIESQNKKILVDCGLFQGAHYCEKYNFEPFPYDPSEIEAVFITHAHIDHIGRLPKLVKEGFKGKVFSTPPTKDFAKFLLLDSEDILSREAVRENKEPPYSTEDIHKLMGIWEEVKYYENLNHYPFLIKFYNAGHILGSASIVINIEGKKIVFSGDLGNVPMPMIPPTDNIEEPIDYALIESAYGDRIHEDLKNRKDLLENFIEETIRSGGVLMIPAFAMERTQELLFELNELVENGRIPRVPIYIDSPLAIKLTNVYKEYSSYFNPSVQKLIKSGDEIFEFPGLETALTTEESKKINDSPSPKIIIAGAGMSQGGRIIHHERRYLSDPKSAILFIGYQVKGSLGRRILEGEKNVRIFGEEISVNCKIRSIGGYSAHADQPQLIKWLKPMSKNLKKVFVVQGEEEAATILSNKIKDILAIDAEVPQFQQEVVL